jgi:hypothetical protein
MASFLTWKAWLIFKEFGSLPNPVTGASVSTGDNNSHLPVQQQLICLRLEMRQHLKKIREKTP